MGGGAYNRYPDPYQHAIKDKLAQLKKVKKEAIFLGNGSDEPIDLLFRAFCEPGKDNVILLPPTYGMYSVCAAINNIEIKEVPLSSDYQLRTNAVLQAVDAQTKVIFICSPNNPTGNSINKEDILQILDNFSGIVVVDEAYIDFASTPSFIELLEQYPQLMVLQTFSKAWGMAGLRLGMAFCNPEIVSVFNNLKFPYNINQLTQEHALVALDNATEKDKLVADILSERAYLKAQLSSLDNVKKIFPSDANFLLVQVQQAKAVFDTLIESKIIVRDRSRVMLCNDCLRITVGTREENIKLLESWPSL